jgi:hypothetical protein
MPYTMEDYEREVEERVLRKLTAEKLLAHLTPEQRLAGMSPEQRLEGLPREEIEKYLKKLNGAPAQDNPPSQPPETQS